MQFIFAVCVPSCSIVSVIEVVSRLLFLIFLLHMSSQTHDFLHACSEFSVDLLLDYSSWRFVLNAACSATGVFFKFIFVQH